MPAMQQIRIRKKARPERADRWPVLPLDPRDADLLRAKRLARAKS